MRKEKEFVGGAPGTANIPTKNIYPLPSLYRLCHLVGTQEVKATRVESKRIGINRSSSLLLPPRGRKTLLMEDAPSSLPPSPLPPSNQLFLGRLSGPPMRQHACKKMLIIIGSRRKIVGGAIPKLKCLCCSCSIHEEDQKAPLNLNSFIQATDPWKGEDGSLVWIKEGDAEEGRRRSLKNTL